MFKTTGENVSKYDHLKGKVECLCDNVTNIYLLDRILYFKKHIINALQICFCRSIVALNLTNIFY